MEHDGMYSILFHYFSQFSFPPNREVWDGTTPSNFKMTYIPSSYNITHHHYLASCVLSPFLFVSSSLHHILVYRHHNFISTCISLLIILSLYNYFAACNLSHNCVFPRKVPWLCQFTLDTHTLFNWYIFCTLHNHVNLLLQFELMSSTRQKKYFMNFTALNFTI